MAGKPGRSGGPRPGSGRPKKRVAGLESPIPVTETPLAFLLAVMNDLAQEPRLRVRAAVAAAQYIHVKKADGGKKDEKQDAAKTAGAGKFAAGEAPRLVSSR